MFNINNGELVYFRNDEGISEAIIPEEVTKIGETAFLGAKIESVKLHPGLKEIGEAAFQSSDLKTVNIPASVKRIDDVAFRGCGFLKEAIINGADTELGAYVFEACSSLEHLTINSSLLKRDLLDSFFARMIAVTFPDLGIETVVAFRKGHSGNKKFEYKDDVLYPTGGQATEVYDRLLAEGKYDGFAVAENPRIKAILLRITDKNDPISDNVKPQFQNFLLSKFQKTLKTALEGNIEVVIPALVDLGVIYDETESKAIKALKKLGSEEATQIAESLHDWISRG